MAWVDKPQNYKDLYGILQLLRGSNWNNFLLKTLKVGWVAFHSLTFPLKCLDFQCNQYKKLVPVLSRFCNGLLVIVTKIRQGHVSSFILWLQGLIILERCIFITFQVFHHFVFLIVNINWTDWNFHGRLKDAGQGSVGWFLMDASWWPAIRINQ